MGNRAAGVANLGISKRDARDKEAEVALIEAKASLSALRLSPLNTQRGRRC
jgi:hypothetical protein